MAYATIQWFEIEVDDLTAGEKFYREAIGFSTEQKLFNDHPLVLITDKLGNTVGALIPRKSEHMGGITMWYKVPFDLSQFLIRVEQLGGKVIEPKKLLKNKTVDGKTVIPKNLIDHNIGYYALCTDPFGNRFALYSNS